MANKQLELAVRPRLEIKIEDKQYTVEYPLSAVIAAEEKAGRSLKSLSEWFEIKLTEVAHVLHAGVVKHHPEVSFAEIEKFCEELGAEGVLAVRHALICLNFPRTMEEIAKRQQSGASPNGQSAGGQ
jgi:hypothetical protein